MPGKSAVLFAGLGDAVALGKTALQAALVIRMDGAAQIAEAFPLKLFFRCFHQPPLQVKAAEGRKDGGRIHMGHLSQLRLRKTDITAKIFLIILLGVPFLL